MTRAIVLLVLLAACLPLAASLRLPSGWERRAVLAAAAAAISVPHQPARASYALQRANVQAHSWDATGKERERAVYMEIEEQLDRDRRFRPDVGTLGYVGGEYTKKSMAGRHEYETARAARGEGAQNNKDSGFMRAEDVMALGGVRRTLVAP